ncbi:peptidase inhibitor 16 [Perognathus longimembris pacificus]|uniref:peptidase inhibitor 16 n=1 Tax=Perognathus longimembris pacificus TaxID=214514 RepID=UPI0020189204|nr:peptidase inhibitor 16 [Perognathus longimembris pacificus]
MLASGSLRALPPLLLLLLGATVALRDDEKLAMVELHNLYRAQVAPPASNMRLMRWDEELAAFAKAYAQKCIWGHNKERGRRGENLFAITDEGLDVPLAVEEWHQERQHYNLSAAACEPGQVCGHYTQVVWSKTERIGCGSHFCETLQGVEETNIHLLVCNYVPPGNVKGQRPYEEGTPCSQCPAGYDCKNSLCMNLAEPTKGPEEKKDLPHLETEARSTLATEVSGSKKPGITTVATEIPSFSVTDVSGSPASEVPSALATSSLATSEPFSMATEGQPSQAPEVPAVFATQRPLSSDERLVIFPQSTQVPVPTSVDKGTGQTSVPSTSPKMSLYPEMFPPGAGAPLPPSPKEAQAELPPSGEVLASVFPAQDNPGELQVTVDHPGPNSSKSLPKPPNASALANAVGGRTLALQSSLPGTEDPSGNSSHSPGPLLVLLLLPLLLASVF